MKYRLLGIAVLAAVLFLMYAISENFSGQAAPGPVESNRNMNNDLFKNLKVN